MIPLPTEAEAAEVVQLLDLANPAADLLRLVVDLANSLNVYDPEAGEYEQARTVWRDLDGGAGLVDLRNELTFKNLRTLREVLDVLAANRRPDFDVSVLRPIR